MKYRLFLFLAFGLLLILPGNALSKEQQKLSQNLELGIGQYKHENYEEALPHLLKARDEEPESTLAAYYLGITYKKIQNYKKAIPHLRDAVTYTPKIKGALIELIDCLYNYNELEEAREWIAEAEREGIRPAQIKFLKGLVLLKNEEYAEAIEAFKEAQQLDKSMDTAANYQMAIAHLKRTELDEAEEIFEEIISLQPTSNLAKYADQYVEAIARRKEALRHWRFSFGSAWQYDDNVVLKPESDAIATGISNEADWRNVYTVQTEYNHRFKDRYGIKTIYSLYIADQYDLDFYDTISQSVIVQPAIYFERSVLLFPTTYNHTMVDDRSYLANPTAGIQYNFLIGNSQLGQVSVKYSYEDFLWTPIIPDENRDADDLSASVGYSWFFASRKGIVNFRYTFNDENTDGRNWDNQGHRFNSAVVIPVTEKLKVTAAGSIYLQDFDNTNSVFGIKREDEVYTMSAYASYKIYKDCEFQIQYTYVRNDANISVYDYDRNIYSTGIQLKF